MQWESECSLHNFNADVALLAWTLMYLHEGVLLDDSSSALRMKQLSCSYGDSN